MIKNIKYIATTVTFLMGATASYAEQHSSNEITNLPKTGFADLVEVTSPSVVVIKAEQMDGRLPGQIMRSLPSDPPVMPNFPSIPPKLRDKFENFFHEGVPRNLPRPSPSPKAGIGTGFIISDDGYIVTNHHVVDKSEKISIEMSDGQIYNAVIIGSDPKTDLAVLDIEGEGFPHIEFGNSDQMRVGDVVLAIGSPFGLSGSVSAGIISAKERNIGTSLYDSFIQTDAAINKGNSGGPLINTNGEVIAVNTAIFSNSGGSVGIGFAIPSSIANEIVSQIISDGSVKRGWLGVKIQPVTEVISQALGIEKGGGILVSDVFEGSPADQSGVKIGDIIIEYNGQKIDTPSRLPLLVSQTKAGSKATLVLIRDNEEISLDVRVGKMKDEKSQPENFEISSYKNLEEFGLKMAVENDEIIIVSVKKDSTAEQTGFSVGDKILRLGSKKDFNLSELEESIAEGAALVQVEKSDGQKSFLVIK